MKKCLAFSALVGSRDAWKPCSRKAIRGSAFCGRHTEVLAGVMLGLCVNGYFDGVDAPQRTPSIVIDLLQPAPAPISPPATMT
jgi:hypothetical protein